MKKILSLLLCALLLLLTLLPVGAAVIPSDPTMATVHAAISAHLGQDTPGAAVVVVRRGEPTFCEGYGYTSVESKETLVTPDAAFEIGELSSLLLAVAVYRLSATGALSLHTDVREYLPDNVSQKLDLQYTTTVSHLLLGTAGFEGRTFDLIFERDSHCFAGLADALLAEVPRQTVAPGSCYSASPFGLALAAYVVECVTGQSYESYVTEQLLEPLGMTHTILAPTEETAPALLAVGHRMTEPGSFAVGKRQGRSYAAFYPVSGAISTAADVSALAELLLLGNESVLPESARLALLQDHFKNGSFTVSAPAMAVRGAAMGVDAKTLSYSASLWLDPVQGIAAAVLTNVAESGLVALPATLCGARVGVLPEGDDGRRIDVSHLKGEYLPLSAESHSFVGKLASKNSIERLEVTPDGHIIFEGKTLYQVANGAFADVQSGVVLLQAQLDGAGKVALLLTANGVAYRPAGFLEGKTVSTLLFWVLVALSILLLVLGVAELIHYLARRDSVIYVCR